MAIERLFQRVKVNNSQRSIIGDRLLILITILSGLFVFGCSESKLTQCEQIFRIAAWVNNSSKNVSYSDIENAGEIKSWLEAANMMNRAADKIEALHVNDGELIGYQNQLATIYRIYSQATYNAVRARESKSLSSLKMARIDAQKAGSMQQELIQDLNDYCLSR